MNPLPNRTTPRSSRHRLAKVRIALLGAFLAVRLLALTQASDVAPAHLDLNSTTQLIPGDPAPTNSAPTTVPAKEPAPHSDPHAAEAVVPPTSNSTAILPVNSALRDSQHLIPSSNLLAQGQTSHQIQEQNFQAQLETGLQLRQGKNYSEAEKTFIRLLKSEATAEIKKTALLEMAVMAHQLREFIKAQQIYAQYLQKYPEDQGTPEILLRQGLIYREMSAPVMALSKFYSVMSSALNIKVDQLDYYQRLVLQAQAEIADTYYLQGQYAEAAEFFGRLMKLDSPSLDKSKILYKLVRSYWLRGRHADVVNYATLSLNRFSEAETAAEMRFLLADSLKKMGRNREAMEHVLALLQSQQRASGPESQNWIYWQQRTGNDIANQLYQEGDYFNALQIYFCLANLNESPDWQLPALYQIGLVYERLRQPDKASETYDRILKRQETLGTNAPSPNLLAVLDMAKFRKGYIGWLEKAEAAARKVNPAPVAPPALSP